MGKLRKRELTSLYSKFNDKLVHGKLPLLYTILDFLPYHSIKQKDKSQQIPPITPFKMAETQLGSSKAFKFSEKIEIMK